MAPLTLLFAIFIEPKCSIVVCLPYPVQSAVRTQCSLPSVPSAEYSNVQRKLSFKFSETPMVMIIIN